MYIIVVIGNILKNIISVIDVILIVDVSKIL